MTLINTFKNNFFFNLFTFFSFQIYFNEKIYYEKIKKKWISIKNEYLLWNHKYGEIKHLIDNIVLTKPHINKKPKYYQFRDSLKNLTKKYCTKYEKFTTKIVNSHTTDPKIIIHLKNIRNDNDTDLPLITLIMYISNTNKKVYKISNFTEVHTFFEIFLPYIKGNKLFIFTDWRYLYRNNLSFSYHNPFFFRKFIKYIINIMNIHIYIITMTNKNLYATELF